MTNAKSISLFAMSLLGVAVACGSDDDGGGLDGTGGGQSGGSAGASTGGSGTGGGGGSTGGSGGSTAGGSAGAATGGSAGIASGGGAGADPLAECKAQAATNPDPACANCACDNCLTEIQKCEQSPECVALRDCAQANNCCDAACAIGPCGAEVSAAVSAGVLGDATAVGDCVNTAQCNCCT